MALIWRSVLQVDGDFTADMALERFSGWLRWKLDAEDFVLPAVGEKLALDNGVEVLVNLGSDNGAWVVRAQIFEPREDTAEQVKTTFTALDDGSGPWTWVDLERWSERAYDGSWVPLAPGIVRNLLDGARCRRGPTEIRGRARRVGPHDAAALAADIADRQREVPIVVVSPTRQERDADMKPALDRAHHLLRRLRGVAVVAVLDPGATTALSRALLGAFGEGMDVHSGAIRTYLPLVRRERNSRHRLIPYHRLDGRDGEALARLVAPELLRAACLQQPPTAWREVASPLIADQPGVDMAEHELLDSLLGLAERERDTARAEAEEALEALDFEREELAASLSEKGRLQGRVRYLERLLRERAVEDRHEEEVPFDPEFCSEVVEQAAHELSGLAIPDSVHAAAEQLDGHNVRSWAQKGWRALSALNAYAAEKQAGHCQSDFFGWLRDGNGDMPLGWLTMHESETTDNNGRFRTLRTFPVASDVHPSGEAYMPAHIKIEAGGYPAPRLHFLDDTDGQTGKVHIGWFGPHRDNASKS